MKIKKTAKKKRKEKKEIHIQKFAKIVKTKSYYAEIVLKSSN